MIWSILTYMKIKLPSQNVNLVHKKVNSEASKQFLLEEKHFTPLLGERSMWRHILSVWVKPPPEKKIPTMGLNPR